VSDRVPPNSEAAERALLGTVIIAPECLPELADIAVDDFFFPAHRAVWECVRSLQRRGRVVNVVSLQDEARAQGCVAAMPEREAFLLTLATEALPPIHLRSHMDTIRKMATLRRLIGLCSETAARAYSLADADDVLADIRNGVSSLEVSSNSVGPERLCDLLDPAISEIGSRFGRTEDHVVRSGIAGVDEITGGFRRGHFVVVGGLPSMGKTAAAVGVLAHNCLNSIPCYLISLEMDRQEVVERILAMRARVSATDLYTGAIRKTDGWDRVNRVAKKSWDWPLWVDDRPMSVNKIIGETHRWFAKCARACRPNDPNPIALVVVDYLGLIQSEDHTESRNREIAKMAQSLKCLGKELRIPVMSLAQLNREVLKRGGEPTMADLRDSGELEAAAQVVIFPWREQHLKAPEAKPVPFQPEEAKWIIAKNTGGRRGSAPVLWHRERMEFTDPDGRFPMEPPASYNERGEHDG
jgi:replicative DNA helicase